jgi:hypothetical protein
LPYGSSINGFVEITFACATIATKNYTYFFFFSDFMSQCNTISHPQHSTQMRYHTYNVVFVGTKMERALTAF